MDMQLGKLLNTSIIKLLVKWMCFIKVIAICYSPYYLSYARNVAKIMLFG